MPLKKKSVQPTVTAPATTPVVEEKERAQAILDAETEVVSSVVNSENVGSKAGNLSFVCCLGDPSTDDITYLDTVGPDGKKEKVVAPMIVGYRFKADIDLEVPDVNPGDDFRKNYMSFTGDTSKTRHVPAGTEFDLTKFETGMLISREEFNGQANGGAIKVSCAYAVKTKKAGDGTVVSTGAPEVPSIALKATNGGSVKDAPMVDVLSFTKKTVMSENGKPITRKERVVNPGFEKWEPLCRVATVVGGRGSTASPVNKRNKMAEQFLRVASSKKA